MLLKQRCISSYGSKMQGSNPCPSATYFKNQSLSGGWFFCGQTPPSTSEPSPTAHAVVGISAAPHWPLSTAGR
ncbi:hypothetical protein LMG33810_000985 [Carnimonas sp. LMG 33810]